jgi:hypothetical protein
MAEHAEARCELVYPPTGASDSGAHASMNFWLFHVPNNAVKIQKRQGQGCALLGAGPQLHINGYEGLVGVEPLIRPESCNCQWCTIATPSYSSHR